MQRVVLERHKAFSWDCSRLCLGSGVDDGSDSGELRLHLYSSDLKNHLLSCHSVSLQTHKTMTFPSNLQGSVPHATAPDPSSDMVSYYPETAEVITARVVYGVFDAA